MDFETVKQKFGTWAEPFRNFIATAAFDQIYTFLRAASKRGKVICPDSSQTFRCFEQTPYDMLRAVLVFSAPYPQRLRDKKIADGIALSCSGTGRLTTGLEKFYRGLELELSGGLNLDMVDTPDLSYLCNQGILLYNTALTTELDKPGSHLDIWQPFTEYFFTEVINTYKKGVPIVFFGKQAASYSRLVYPFNHWVFETADLQALTAEEQWNPDGLFKNINEIIGQNNPAAQPVVWFKEIGQPQSPTA